MLESYQAEQILVDAHTHHQAYKTRGVIPGGAGGLLANNIFFSGFSHTTDRKVPSEVVLMGSLMSVIYDKTAIFQLKSQ